MKPQKDEYPEFFARYVALVPEDDVVSALVAQGDATAAVLSSITEEKAAFRYAPDKWSIKQLVNHMADAERIFNYRTVSIARGDTRPLLGFDEQAFAAAAESDRRAFREIADEVNVVRKATIALFKSLSDTAWKRVGIANDSRMSVRALAFVTLGHERHHLKVLREKYL